MLLRTLYYIGHLTVKGYYFQFCFIVLRIVLKDCERMQHGACMQNINFICKLCVEQDVF